jgi:hypothetical protein
MKPPSLDAVRAHVSHGGLWRIVPRAHPPLFVLLLPAQGRAGAFVSLNGGGTPEEHLARPEHGHLIGAAWVPCNAKGDRI